jgi:hypothetical protein
MADGFDIAAYCSTYQSRIEEAKVCRRADLPARHAKLDEELRAARRQDPDQAKALAEQLVALEAEMTEATDTFTFQGLADELWHTLLAAHPPTRPQLDLRPGLSWNPDTFPAAAVASSSLEPKLDVAAVQSLRATMRPADFERLWDAAWNANQEVTVVPKSGLATVTLRATGASSITSAPAASPAPSSSATTPNPSRRSTTTPTAA